MDKATLSRYVTDGLSSRQIAAKMEKSQTTIKYWLKKLDLFTRYVRGREATTHKCTSCGEVNESSFYKGRKRACKKCVNQNDTIIKRNRKIAAIHHMGGRCVDCGYNRYYGALDFHHLDKSTKEGQIKFGNWGMSRILKELEKCVLLCSNCHRERHGEEDYGWCRERESNPRR